MEWNVKNAMNRDVEREHLNKILKEIASRFEQLTTTQAAPTRPTYTPPVVQRPPLTVTLTGDVTGTATGSGSLTIETSLEELTGGLEDAPDDGSVYWRGNQQWLAVPLALQVLDQIEGEGLLALSPAGVFENREIIGTEGEIDVENGTGAELNPILSLADVPDVGGGVLQKTEFDGKGRKTGTSGATTDDLDEGATNLYFLDERAQDAVGDVLEGGGDVGLFYEDTPDRRIYAELSEDILEQLAEAASALQPGDNVSSLVNDVGYTSNVGTVTNVAATVPTGLEVAGSPITTSGTLAITYQAGFQGYTTTEATKLAGVTTGATAYTDALARAAAVADSITDGITDVAPSQKAVFDALAGKEPSIATGTTGQFYRGDKVFSDTLTAPLILDDGSAKVQIGNFASARIMFDDVSAPGSRYGLDAFGGSFRMFNDVTNFPLLNISADPFGFNPSITSFMDFIPNTDNLRSVGKANNRWAVIYAASGAINTSDAREKTTPRDMTPAEIACGLDIARLPCIFQWLESIAEKGEDARLHAGPTVQDVIAAMESHGLDPFRYSFICYDKWEEQQEIVHEWDEERDEAGKVTRDAGREVVQEYRPAGDRYSLRPSGLDAFCRRALVADRDELEARLAALENRNN